MAKIKVDKNLTAEKTLQTKISQCMSGDVCLTSVMLLLVIPCSMTWSTCRYVVPREAGSHAASTQESGYGGLRGQAGVSAASSLGDYR